MTAAAPALHAQALAKTYDRSRGGEALRALDAVDLTLEPGAFVAIVGPSGCGKSTLLKLLAGLLEPTEGDVLLDGEPAGDRLLREVAYLPQKDLLMPWRSVLDNVTIGLELAGVGRDAARERARVQLGRFGLDGFERRWPRELSDGMRQRAALLRTVLAGRRILLLDEPFGALDALTRRAMQEWLLELWEAEGMSVLLVTHDVDEALLLADRVAVMRARPGAIVATAEIALPRPRTAETTTTPAFGAAKAALLEPLRAGYPEAAR